MRVLVVTSSWPGDADPADSDVVARQVACLRQAGLEVEEFALAPERREGMVRGAVRLRRMLRQGRFDLVHAQFGPLGALVSAETNLPMVVTVRSNDVREVLPRGRRVRSWTARWLSGYAARHADEAVVVSAHLIGRLPPRAYHVLPTGLDLQRFTPMAQGQARQTLGLGATTRIILTAGEGPPTGRVVNDEILQQVRQRQPADVVDLDSVSAEQKALYLNASDVLLCTTPMQVTGQLISQALACNLPVVAAGWAGSAETPPAGCTVCADTQPATFGAAVLHWLETTARPQSRQAVLRYEEHHLAGDLIGIYQRARASRASRIGPP